MDVAYPTMVHSLVLVLCVCECHPINLRSSSELSFCVCCNLHLNFFSLQINPDDYAKRRKRDINENHRLNEITNLAIKSFEKYKNKNR